jgi:hypothetical protein
MPSSPTRYDNDVHLATLRDLARPIFRYRKIAGPTFLCLMAAVVAIAVLVGQFVAGFDYVLTDIAPVTWAGGAAGLSLLVGNVMLVVADDSTRRMSARRLTQILHGCGPVVIGAVLTNLRYPIPKALYRRL